MTDLTGLGRSTRTMAIGTVVSRGTGFLRTATLTAVLGLGGVGFAYNLANTAPNIIYELLLGGVLTSAFVPLLVRAAKEHADRGEAYAQRLLSLTVVALGALSLLLVVLAPVVVDLYTSGRTPAADRELAVTFARYFLPQVVFYGAGAVIGGILNTRGRFGAPMWAPVLNNVVVIATAALFLLLPGRQSAGSLTSLQVNVLGIGTTLGIVAQTAALVPSLLASGFRFQPRLDLRGSGLGVAARLARWVFVYVLANQLALLVLVRLSSALQDTAPGRGYPTYVAAYVLWQLPHAVIAVSVISALLPAMSQAAADDRPALLRRQLSHGTRLVTTVLIPAVAAYVVLGGAIATLIFSHGLTTPEQARYIGATLAVLALGLLPYSAFQLQLRAFYALQDTRTPALISLAVNGVNIAIAIAAVEILAPRSQILGLAGGYAASNVVGLALSSRLLSRRLGGLDSPRVVRTTVRCVVAVAPAGLAAVGVQAAFTQQVGRGGAGALGSVLGGGGVLVMSYLVAVRRMRVRELDELLGPALRRLGLADR